MYRVRFINGRVYMYVYISLIILIIFYHPYIHISILKFIYHPIYLLFVHLCEALESNNTDSGAIQINGVFIIIITIACFTLLIYSQKGNIFNQVKGVINQERIVGIRRPRSFQ